MCFLTYFSRVLPFFLILCLCGFVCVRARAWAGARAAGSLLDVLFAQHTITFLLSDRVSRRTRDRARQCALEPRRKGTRTIRLTYRQRERERLAPPPPSSSGFLPLSHGNFTRAQLTSRLDYLTREGNSAAKTCGRADERGLPSLASCAALIPPHKSRDSDLDLRGSQPDQQRASSAGDWRINQKK